MFKTTDEASIYITCGDVADIVVNASDSDEEPYVFSPGDIVRLMVFERNKHDNVVINKSVEVNEETTNVLIQLSSKETRVCGMINRPVDYWYEVELNPDSDPHTIIGYDEDGPKIFRFYPEGVASSE